MHVTELRDFMTMATHDLRSPLAAATMHLELFRDDHAGQLGDDECLRATSRALGRLSDLVDDLLTYATADQRDLDLRPMPLDRAIARRLADIEGAVSVRGELPAVRADAKLVGHVLDNLLGNAVKYTRPGSRPTIEISARPCADDMIRIEVADRGIGIPAHDRPKVFEAFHRSTNSGAYRGTGLGLSICRRIVERHGGRIGVEENEGGGSRFWFTLPASRPERLSAASR